MAIERIGYGDNVAYYIICDRCDAESTTAFETFDEAAKGKARAGFKSVRTGGVWEDQCERCRERL